MLTAVWVDLEVRPGCPTLIPGKEGYLYELHYGGTGLASKFDINRNETWYRNSNYREVTENINDERGVKTDRQIMTYKYIALRCYYQNKLSLCN